MPYRSENHHYSGPLKKTLTDPKTIQKLFEQLNLLNSEILEDPNYFKTATPNDLNYRFRGDLYILVNKLMIISVDLHQLQSINGAACSSLIVVPNMAKKGEFPEYLR